MKSAILGVVVALLGVGAIYLQTRATRIAAEAARDYARATARSVKLQENTQRQWVNLDEWGCFRINPTDPLEVTFQVINPTQLPVTLHAVFTTVNGKPTEREGSKTLLIPGYPFLESVGVPLDPGQESLYARDALDLEIKCMVLFMDSHGIHWRQKFTRMLLCRHGKSVVTDIGTELDESGAPGERGSRDVELPN